MTPAPAAICLQIVQKEHKKLPQIGCILKVQSGRRTDLPLKWIQLPFQRSPRPHRSPAQQGGRPRLRHPTVPPPMPGNRRAADRLLTLSRFGAEFLIQDSTGTFPFSRCCPFSLQTVVRPGRRQPTGRTPAKPCAKMRKAPGLLLAGRRALFVWAEIRSHSRPRIGPAGPGRPG